MPGRFVIAKDVEPQVGDFGTLFWLSTPPNTGAKQLQGHNFHKIPDQEGVILVIVCWVVQWIDREKRMLGPGDCAFIPADVVHASFNTSGEPVKLAAILGPCVGPAGYELVDVASDAPWNTLRK